MSSLFKSNPDQPSNLLPGEPIIRHRRDRGALQCSCFPVRVAPGGGIESLEESGGVILGLEGKATPFSDALGTVAGWMG